MLAGFGFPGATAGRSEAAGGGVIGWFGRGVLWFLSEEDGRREWGDGPGGRTYFRLGGDVWPSSAMS